MTAPVPPINGDEWPAQAADAIVKVVDNVRNQTAKRAQTGAKALKYGPPIAVFGIIVAIALPIFVLRLLERGVIRIGDLLGTDVLDNPMWAIYMVVGLALTIAGRVLWKKARI